MTETLLSPSFIEVDKALEAMYIAIQDRYNRYSVKDSMARIRSIYETADEECRYKIVTDLTAMKFSGVVPFLVDALCNDESALVRHEAAFGIGTLGSRRNCGPLIEALKNDESEMVRHEAAIALAEIGGVNSIPDLELATIDHDPAVASSARFAIQSILLYHLQGLKVANG